MLKCLHFVNLFLLYFVVLLIGQFMILNIRMDDPRFNFMLITGITYIWLMDKFSKYIARAIDRAYTEENQHSAQ